MHRHILCIDLKSFFASVECVERGLDPFKYPLVVTNPLQGNGAMTLAVTPYLKSQGVKSRSRLYEIPSHINYYIVPPRMNLYIKKSKEVVSIYLDFVSSDDLLIYSIDECFLDITNYLKFYNKNDEDIAENILKTIYKKTGLTATCGIGPNMLLAKIAMDVDAKHNKNNIAKWTMVDVKEKLWKITPLSEMWGIGKRMEANLNKMGIYTVGDLAQTNKYALKDKFGIMGLELWNHANGVDESVISDYKNIAKEESFSHSQVLFKDYNADNVIIIIKEMVSVLTARMRKSKKVCGVVGLGISYSKKVGGGFYHNMKLNALTDSEEEIINYCLIIFDKFYENLPIRKVSISLGLLKSKDNEQLSLFKKNKDSSQDKVNATIDNIKERFGKNSLIKGSNLLKDSTAIERNKKTGGHYS